MDSKIRVALIGFGTMGRNYAGMIAAGMVPNMTLSLVCCRNREGQELLKQKFPGVKICPDVDALASCGEDFDAALIVTPHKTHVAIARQMVSLGKPILMDKPAGLAAGEVEELVALCREKGVPYGMIFNNRMLPAFRVGRELLKSGAIGTLHRAVWVCNSWYRSPVYHASGSWRSSWEGEGGGLLINQNVHYLDMWQWFFGLPDRVYADLQFGRYNDFLVDDGADIQFSYDSGFHGTMVSASGEAPGVNRLEIWGSKGRLIIEDGARLSIDENEVSTEEFAVTNRIPFGTIPHTLREIPLEACPNPYIEVLDNFARHLLRGEPLHADGTDGLRTAQLTNAAYISGWEGCRVSLPPAPGHYESGLARRIEMEKER